MLIDPILYNMSSQMYLSGEFLHLEELFGSTLKEELRESSKAENSERPETHYYALYFSGVGVANMDRV